MRIAVAGHTRNEHARRMVMRLKLYQHVRDWNMSRDVLFSVHFVARLAKEEIKCYQLRKRTTYCLSHFIGFFSGTMPENSLKFISS